MGFIRKLRRLNTTIRYLKPQQVLYQLYYRLPKPILSALRPNLKFKELQGIPVKWDQDLRYPNTFLGEREFVFLNKSYRFEEEIDWEKEDFGKLWAYNLNYFDFLNQEAIAPEVGLGLIRLYMAQMNHKTGNEPFPTSLRGINWVKFLSRHQINDHAINTFLYREFQRLGAHLEYHIMGNHLLENGLSLLFAGVYFQDKSFFNKSKRILEKQLPEQILEDGAHFERSPMYHRIILHRILDCLHLLNQNKHEKDNLYSQLKHAAGSMLSWLEAVCYPDGSVPMVNDSIPGLAFKPQALFSYARKIGVQWHTISLGDSGYRMTECLPFIIFADFGDIGPDYIPGHAHADTFSFEVHYKGAPVIVDTGTSTYEFGERRQEERGTAAHNTVRINGEEQSDVWGNFRVGRRAKVRQFKETENSIEAIHDGYKHLGIHHYRKIQSTPDSITITDKIIRKKQGTPIGEAFIHLHPEVHDLVPGENGVVLNGLGIAIRFEGTSSTPAIEKYEYATGYNLTREAMMLRITFKEQLITHIGTC